MDSQRVIGAIRPDRYVVAVFLFFVLFPVFMDLITPDVITGYAGGTVDPQGNVVSRYEGGNAPQYQWWYPIVLPFMVVWYVAVLLFGLVDGFLPANQFVYYAVQAVYFYLLALVLGGGLRRGMVGLAGLWARVAEWR